VKFFLHISKEEQAERLRERLADPTKHWKVNDEDFVERRRWDDYVSAYEDALSQCSTAVAPWYIIPADHKWYRDHAVAGILRERLEAIDPQFPPAKTDVSKLRV